MNNERDYLVEAQRIAAGSTLLLAQREHVVALIEWDANLTKELADTRAALAEHKAALAAMREALEEAETSLSGVATHSTQVAMGNDARQTLIPVRAALATDSGKRLAAHDAGENDAASGRPAEPSGASADSAGVSQAATPAPSDAQTLASWFGTGGTVDRLRSLRDTHKQSLGPLALAILEEGIATIAAWRAVMVRVYHWTAQLAHNHEDTEPGHECPRCWIQREIERALPPDQQP